MKKVIKWLKESNRYKHLMGGMLIGAECEELAKGIRDEITFDVSSITF